MDGFINFLGSFFGGLIASLIAIIIWEQYKKPKLVIDIPQEKPAIQTLPNGAKRSFYHLMVKNIGRSPAYNCKIFMRFLDETGNRLIISDTINGKWDRGPEPVINLVVPIQTHNSTHLIQFETQQTFLIPFSEILDIHNNVNAEGFCPFIKYENDSECYAFSAWSYLRGLPPGHKVPQWKINYGKTILEIELIYSGNKSLKQRFLVDNQSNSAVDVQISKLLSK